MKEPRTLAQMARDAIAESGGDPWACRQCGCRDWRVKDSRHDGIQRRRLRICRHCGEPLTTIEVPIKDGQSVEVR